MHKACFCFDIDGTLLNSNHQITQTTLQTLYQLKERGHKVIIATGRNYGSVKDSGLFEVFDWDALVLNNGQCVINSHHELIHLEAIDSQTIDKLIKVSYEEDVVIALETMDDWFTIQPPNEYTFTAHQFFNEIPPKQKIYDPSMKIVMAMAYAPLGYTYEAFKKIDGICVAVGNSTYADIGKEGYHKYKGIEKCLEYFQIKETVCFGDGRNDIDMIRHATIGVAMGQGIDEVKNVSCFVTKSNDEEGISYACRKLGYL